MRHNKNTCKLTDINLKPCSFWMKYSHDILPHCKHVFKFSFSYEQRRIGESWGAFSNLIFYYIRLIVISWPVWLKMPFTTGEKQFQFIYYVNHVAFSDSFKTFSPGLKLLHIFLSNTNYECTAYIFQTEWRIWHPHQPQFQHGPTKHATPQYWWEWEFCIISGVHESYAHKLS